MAATPPLPSTGRPPAAALAPRMLPAARAWAVVLILSLIFAVGMADRVLLSMMIAPIKADLGLSDAAIGIVQGAAVASFYVLFALPVGWASDRFDRRLVLFVGVSVWSLASAATAFARDVFGLFAARAMIGAGESVIGPSGYPLIARSVRPERLALAMMLFYVGGNAGIAAGQFLGGALLDWLSHHGAGHAWPFGITAPWRLIFLLTGLPGLLLGAMIFIAPREKAAATAGGATPDGRSFPAFFAAHRRFYLSHNVGCGFQQAALTGATLWNAAFMARTYGWSPARIGGTFGLILIATSTTAVIAHSWISARLFARGTKDAYLRWQLAMCGCTVPALALAYLWHAPIAACLGFAFANLASGGGPVAGPTMLQIATPHGFRGRVNAVYVVIATLLGTAAGPAAIGVFTDFLLHDERRLGIAVAVCSIAFCLLAAAAFAVGLAPARRLVDEAAAAPIQPDVIR